jgi:hypothetical protein
LLTAAGTNAFTLRAFDTLFLLLFLLGLRALFLLHLTSVVAATTVRLLIPHNLAIVTHVQIFPADIVPNRLNAHALREILSLRKAANLRSDDNRIIQALGDSRWNVDLSSTPCRPQRCIPQRRVQQWFENWLN